MFLTIADVLPEDRREEVSALLPLLAWKPGVETAGETARAVKQNEQADLSSRSGAKLKNLLREAILGHPVLQAYARPRRVSKLIVSRTRDGGHYGLHIDNSRMGHGPESLRTDLSFTLFLADPDTYEGGHLAIEMSGMTQRAKGQPGELVLYPSTTLHGVEPVTKGERIVCVGWIESEIRSGDQREILFDLENLKAELSRQHDANSPEMLILAKTMANLRRMWTE